MLRDATAMRTDELSHCVEVSRALSEALRALWPVQLYSVLTESYCAREHGCAMVSFDVP